MPLNGLFVNKWIAVGTRPEPGKIIFFRGFRYPTLATVRKTRNYAPLAEKASLNETQNDPISIEMKVFLSPFLVHDWKTFAV